MRYCAKDSRRFNIRRYRMLEQQMKDHRFNLTQRRWKLCHQYFQQMFLTEMPMNVSAQIIRKWDLRDQYVIQMTRRISARLNRIHRHLLIGLPTTPLIGLNQLRI